MTHKLIEFYPESITRIIDNSKLALDVCHLIEDGYTKVFVLFQEMAFLVICSCEMCLYIK